MMSYLYFLALLLFSPLALAQIQDDLPPRFEHFKKDIIKHFSSIATRFDERTDPKNGYSLARIDLDFSLSLEKGIDFFSIEKEKGIELVWQRNQKEEDSKEVEILISSDPNETSHLMLGHIWKLIGLKRAEGKLRKKIIRRVYKDAKRIHRYIDAVRSFNGQENWYVANYFKNYYFSAEGDLKLIGLSYDKRLRFRFKSSTVLAPSEPRTRYERLVHKKLRRMARHFQEIQNLDTMENRFTMNRVRSLTDMEVGINFGIGEISKGKGLLLEWLPQEESYFITKNQKTKLGAKTLRSIANLFEQNIKDGNHFELGQIRLKSSLTKNLDIIFFGKSLSRNTEYHYRRRP